MKKSSIKKRVLYINLILFLVLICQGIFSYIVSSKIEHKSESINTQKFPSVTLVNQLNFQVKELAILLEDAITADPEEAYDLDNIDWELFDSSISSDSIFKSLEFDEATEAIEKIKKSIALVDSIETFGKSPLLDSLKIQFPKFQKGYASILVPKIKEVRPEDDEDGEDEEDDEDEVISNNEESEKIDPQKEIKRLFSMINEYKETTNVQISGDFININTLAQNFFLVSVAIFILLVTILTGFLIFFTKVARSLVKLSNDATVIKEGNLDHTIVQDRYDELGTLQVNFDSMRTEVKDFIENLDQKVQERTKEVNEEKKKIADLMNNMKQAVFKAGEDGTVLGPVSAYTNEVFGGEIVGTNIFDTVYKGVEKESEVGVAITSTYIAVFGEDDMQWDLSEDNLPRKIVRQIDGIEDKILKLSYAPLWSSDDELQEIMYVVEDITELEALAREKAKSDENIQMIQSISNSNFDDLCNYFSSTESLLANTESILHSGSYDAESFALLFRNLHTIKGNSRIYTFSLVSTATHTVESLVTRQLAQLKSEPVIEDSTIQELLSGIKNIRLSLEKYAKVGREVFKVSLDGKSLTSPDAIVQNAATVKVLQKNFAEMEQLLNSFEEKSSDKRMESILQVFRTLYEVDVMSSFNKYKSMISEMSEVMNKKINFDILGDEVSMSKDRLTLLHDAFIHMIRNSADHGIESIEDRLKSGKSEEGQISIIFKSNTNGFTLTMKDDGAGIPADKIYQKAIDVKAIDVNKKLSESEKLMLIFLPNLSTKEEISELSGRGVGMDVVKTNIESIGGTIKVISELGKGTEFILDFHD